MIEGCAEHEIHQLRIMAAMAMKFGEMAMRFICFLFFDVFFRGVIDFSSKPLKNQNPKSMTPNKEISSLVGGDWNMDVIFPYIGKNHPN